MIYEQIVAENMELREDLGIALNSVHDLALQVQALRVVLHTFVGIVGGIDAMNDSLRVEAETLNNSLQRLQTLVDSKRKANSGV